MSAGHVTVPRLTDRTGFGFTRNLFPKSCNGKYIHTVLTIDIFTKKCGMGQSGSWIHVHWNITGFDRCWSGLQELSGLLAQNKWISVEFSAIIFQVRQRVYRTYSLWWRVYRYPIDNLVSFICDFNTYSSFCWAIYVPSYDFPIKTSVGRYWFGHFSRSQFFFKTLRFG